MMRNAPTWLLGLLSFIFVFLNDQRPLQAQAASSDATSTATDDANATDDTAEIEKLVEKLIDGDLQSRRDAAWMLGDFGPAAVSAVTALANAASDRDPQVSNGALQSLGRIGPAASEAIPAIVEALRDGNEQRRYRAAFALGHIAPPDHESFQQGLHSESEPIRIATAVAVGWLGPEGHHWAPDLVRLLDAENDEDAQQVLIALGRLDIASVPALREALSSNESSTQRLARTCAATEQLGPNGEAAADALAELISDEGVDLVARAAAVRALAAVAPDSSQTGDRLQLALNDDSPQLQQAALNATIANRTLAVALQNEIVKLLDADPESANLAALAMGRIGKDAVPIVPELLARLRTENADSIINTVSRIGPLAIPALMRSAAHHEITVGQAVQIVRQMGPAAEPSLMAATASQTAEHRAVAFQSLGELGVRPADVAAGLNDPKPEVRAAAARGLAAGSQVLASAIPRLKELATDRHSDVRVASLSALIAWNVPPDELLQPLEAALNDPSPTVRASSAEVVGQLSELPSTLVRGLAERLHDNQQDVRLAAATALAATSQDVREALPELIDATKDSSAEVVNQATRALGNIDNLTPEGLNAVADLLRHNETSIKEAALTALSRIGPAALPYREALEELTRDDSSALRVGSVKALVAILPDNPSKRALLVDALDDPDWAVRREMMNALADLGEEAVPAVPRLLEIMKNREDAEGATSALRRIDDAPPEAVPLLIEILQDERTDRRHRYYALHLLRKVGSAAAEALPLLREMRDSSEGRMRDFLDRTIRDVEESVEEATDRGV